MRDLSGKTKTLTDMKLEQFLSAAAENGYRSIANVIEVMPHDYCRRVEIQEIPISPVKAERKALLQKR